MPRPGARDAVKAWMREHAAVKSKADAMAQAIAGLRVEGRASADGHLRRIHDILDYFQDTLVGHIASEERGLFPFLSRHVPRLGALTRLLSAEHLTIMEQLRAIGFLVKDIRGQEWSIQTIKKVGTLKDAGTCFLHALVGHIHEENVSVYRAVTEDLNPGEQAALFRIMQSCRSEYAGKEPVARKKRA